MRLNDAAKGPSNGVEFEGKQHHILPIACQGTVEVGQLEMKRDRILQGVKDGAGRVLDIFLGPLIASEDNEEVNQLKDSIMEAIFNPSKMSTEDVDSILLRLNGSRITSHHL